MSAKGGDDYTCWVGFVLLKGRRVPGAVLGACPQAEALGPGVLGEPGGAQYALNIRGRSFSARAWFGTWHTSFRADPRVWGSSVLGWAARTQPLIKNLPFCSAVLRKIPEKQLQSRERFLLFSSLIQLKQYLLYT